MDLLSLESIVSNRSLSCLKWKWWFCVYFEREAQPNNKQMVQPVRRIQHSQYISYPPSLAQISTRLYSFHSFSSCHKIVRLYKLQICLYCRWDEQHPSMCARSPRLIINPVDLGNHQNQWSESPSELPLWQLHRRHLLLPPEQQRDCRYLLQTVFQASQGDSYGSLYLYNYKRPDQPMGILSNSTVVYLLISAMNNP